MMSYVFPNCFTNCGWKLPTENPSEDFAAKLQSCHQTDSSKIDAYLNSMKKATANKSY